MNEHVLSINEFKEPKVLKDQHSIYTLIIRLLLLEKGISKAHPDMGVGILSRYRNSDIENIDDLKEDIYNQIGRFIPILTVTDIEIEFLEDEKAINISLSMDSNIKYILSADYNTNEIKLVDIL